MSFKFEFLLRIFLKLKEIKETPHQFQSYMFFELHSS